MSINDDIKLLRENAALRYHLAGETAAITRVCDTLEAALKENVELTRKGKELCEAYGTSLMQIHELREALKFLSERIGTTDHEETRQIEIMCEVARKALGESNAKQFMEGNKELRQDLAKAEEDCGPCHDRCPHRDEGEEK